MSDEATAGRMANGQSRMAGKRHSPFAIRAFAALLDSDLFHSFTRSKLVVWRRC